MDIIHSDVWSSLIFSNLGFHYYVIFVDHFSRFTWIFPMKYKTEVFKHFCAFQKLVENIFNTKIKAFQSDGGCEFDNKDILSHLSNCGILFHKSCLDTPQ